MYWNCFLHCIEWDTIFYWPQWSSLRSWQTNCKWFGYLADQWCQKKWWSDLCLRQVIYVKSSQHFLFFSQNESSPVNASELSDFLACLIPDDVSTSGELWWWTRFLCSCKRKFSTFYRRTTCCWKGYGFDVLKTNSQSSRLRIFRPQRLNIWSEYTTGSSN